MTMKLIRDTWLLFVASMRSTLRNPVWIVFGLFQPVCFLLLFAPLLESVAQAPGFPPGGALKVFTPGLLVMIGMFSTLFGGFGLISDLRAGLIERLRVTPVSRLALLLGRALRDVVVLLTQLALLVAVATLMGLRVDARGVLLTLALVALLGLALASCGYALALMLRSEDALAPVLNFLVLPLQLLSGIFLPLTLAPAWIRTAAAFNPLAYVVDAARVLFNGVSGDPAVLRAFVVLGVLAALAVWWAARSFRTAAA
jgi:ABC-2 type transport system permease protein